MFFIHFNWVGKTGRVRILSVGETGEGKMEGGKKGQITGVKGVGKMGVCKMGTNHMNSVSLTGMDNNLFAFVYFFKLIFTCLFPCI